MKPVFKNWLKDKLNLHEYWIKVGPEGMGGSCHKEYHDIVDGLRQIMADDEPHCPDACGSPNALYAETQRRVIEWKKLSDEGLRLRCGELSAREIRTIRAVLNAILPPNNRPQQEPQESEVSRLTRERDEARRIAEDYAFPCFEENSLPWRKQ